MKIKDLPHAKLKELAFNELNKLKTNKLKTNKISEEIHIHMFSWSKSEQGSDFWMYIDSKEYDKALKIYDWEKEYSDKNQEMSSIKEVFDLSQKNSKTMIKNIEKRILDSCKKETDFPKEIQEMAKTGFLIQEEQPVSDFDKVVHETIEDIKHKLVVKGKEYRRNNDVFHNFHEGMKITGQTREDVIWGFALKHFISIQDIKSDLKQGIMPTKEIIDEKYNDLINYLIIEKASILEKIQNNLQ
jgi:hypothetical protein